MSLENLIIIGKNFYYSHTYLALAIVAVLFLFLYFKTKEALKIIGWALVFALIIYGFSILGKTASDGMGKEKQMINQTVDKFK